MGDDDNLNGWFFVMNINGDVVPPPSTNFWIDNLSDPIIDNLVDNIVFNPGIPNS